MKMAIRLKEFAEGLDEEITILDLKPRLKMEVIECSETGPQSESRYKNFLEQINAWGQACAWFQRVGDYREWSAELCTDLQQPEPDDNRGSPGSGNCGPFPDIGQNNLMDLGSDSAPLFSTGFRNPGPGNSVGREQARNRCR